MQRIEIFDGHSDLLVALAKRQRAGLALDFDSPWGQRLRQGGVMGNILVAWADPELDIPLAEQIEDCFAVADALAVAEKELCRIRSRQELVQARQTGQLYYLLGIEGLDGMENKEQLLPWLMARGVRHLSLTWNHDNGFASGTQGTPGRGVTLAGKQLIKETERSPMVLDVSHLNDQSFWDVVKLAQEPIIASHSNCRALCPAARNLNDQQLRAVAALGGVIGVNSYPLFVHESRERQGCRQLADHVEYLVDLLGIEHVGCGFDFNYWDEGPDAVVLSGVEHSGRAAVLLEELAARGYNQAALEQIAGGNLLRVIEQRLG